jgi:predicted nuclease with TOPRIM domain
MSNGNWSTETQAHTQIVILESQNQVKETKIGMLKEKVNLLEVEKMQLKDEVDRLNGLVRTITGGQTNLLDRFK